MVREGFRLEFIEPIYFKKTGLTTIVNGDAVPEADQKEFWRIVSVFCAQSPLSGIMQLSIYEPDTQKDYRFSISGDATALFWYGEIWLKHKLYIRGTYPHSQANTLEYIGEKYVLTPVPRPRRRGFWSLYYI